jgi:hypothetical protein
MVKTTVVSSIVIALIVSLIFTGCIEVNINGETPIKVTETTTPTPTPVGTSSTLTPTPVGTSSYSGTPNAALIVEDAFVGSTTIYIIHHGGDTILNAFTGAPNSDFNDLKVKLNGVDLVFTGTIGDGDNDFESGEKITLKVPALSSDDSIAIVFVPTGEILMRARTLG